MMKHRPFMKKPHVQATLTPCAYCGGRENQLFIHSAAHPDGTPVEPRYNVSCNYCKASGPASKSAAAALEAWAQRAKPENKKQESAELEDEASFDAVSEELLDAPQMA